jgi:hypothetical protein
MGRPLRTNIAQNVTLAKNFHRRPCTQQARRRRGAAVAPASPRRSADGQAIGAHGPVIGNFISPNWELLRRNRELLRRNRELLHENRAVIARIRARFRFVAQSPFVSCWPTPRNLPRRPRGPRGASPCLSRADLTTHPREVTSHAGMRQLIRRLMNTLKFIPPWFTHRTFGHKHLVRRANAAPKASRQRGLPHTLKAGKRSPNIARLRPGRSEGAPVA